LFALFAAGSKDRPLQWHWPMWVNSDNMGFLPHVNHREKNQMTDFPEIFRVRQSFESKRLDDPAAEVREQLKRLQLDGQVSPGQSVAITVGSRGIANIAEIIRAAVEHFSSLGALPFIVPAMGSHGGGTPEGQRRVVESYGITEEFVGCPIRSDTETVVVCETAEGFPVHFDRHAFDADHVLVCNRVKPHTIFVGPIQSGLTKMILIGLGKCEGASIYHKAIQDYDFTRIIKSVMGEVRAKCNILAGLAIVENAYDQTALIEAMSADDIEEREKELLVLAERWLPKLPFDHVDLLLVDRIGKDISGCGMDANVIGRKFNDHAAVEGEFPKVKRIAIRGLSPKSYGNSLGMGMAEFCKSSLLEQYDPAAVRFNVLTSGHVSAAMPPLDYPTDREMIATALGTIGLTAPPDGKLIWITDTLHLAEVECSAAYWNEARQREDLEIISELRPLPFDKDGELPSRGEE